MSLEDYFAPFRTHIIGHKLQHTIYGKTLPILYADWTASGRLYRPIERYITEIFGPYVANTHTETSLTGRAMTRAYQEARRLIKRHVNALDQDILVTAGAGMTAAVNKLQRIMGLRIPEAFKARYEREPSQKPVVFVTHMEHHSNHTSWLECDVTLEVVPPNEQGTPCISQLQQLLQKYRDRPLKIGSFTACSNVTGVQTPYCALAEVMHAHDGLCFVDFAASAPYVDINMHPENPNQQLDAIFFSPHKFLGGPGSSGVLIFNQALYNNRVPDQPGGGTVSWTTPWGKHRYHRDIEAREDGGTPGFLQCIRTALAIRLKEQMGVAKIAARDQEITQFVMSQLTRNPRLAILEPQRQERLPVISFYIPSIHHNLVVRLLNDRFGVQSRGGCSCAGTYGHILLRVDPSTSRKITDQIDQGNLAEKPGWVRLSFHPTMSNQEVQYVVDAVNAVADNAEEWGQAYRFNPKTADFEYLETAKSEGLSTHTPYPTLQAFDAHDMENCAAPTVGEKSAGWIKEPLKFAASRLFNVKPNA